MPKETTFRQANYQHPVLLPLGVLMMVAGITLAYFHESNLIWLGVSLIAILLGGAFLLLGSAEVLQIKNNTLIYRNTRYKETSIPISRILSVTPSPLGGTLHVAYLYNGGKKKLIIPDHFGNIVSRKLRQLAKPEPLVQRNSTFKAIGPYVYSPKPQRLIVSGTCLLLFLVFTSYSSPWAILLLFPSIQFFYLIFLRLELKNQMLVYRTWSKTYKVKQISVTGSYREATKKTWHIIVNDQDIIRIPTSTFPQACYAHLAELGDHKVEQPDYN